MNAIGEPLEGKPHERFDEGAAETQFGCAPPLYSTILGEVIGLQDAFTGYVTGGAIGGSKTIYELLAAAFVGISGYFAVRFAVTRRFPDTPRTTEGGRYILALGLVDESDGKIGGLKRRVSRFVKDRPVLRRVFQ